LSSLFDEINLATLHLALSGVLLIWNIVVAGRVASLHSTPRLLGALSALTGLLLFPAAIVAVAAESVVSGRTLYVIAWIWPATAALVAAQAVAALAQRRIATVIGTTIAAYDILLAVVALAHYLVLAAGSGSTLVLTLSAAQADALALTASPLAMLTPYFLHVPVVAPATAGRRGYGTLMRTAAAIVAGVWLASIALSIPGAARAVRSYARYESDRLQERPQGDFAVGLKILPTLQGPPQDQQLVADLSLADSIGATALTVYIAPTGATAATLDSVANALDDRRSSTFLIAVLDLTDADRPRGAAALDRFFAARGAELRRMAVRLHPDLIVPVNDPYGATARALGRLPVERWMAYLTAARAAVHGANASVGVMAHIGGSGARDSALYAWSASSGAPVDAVGFSLYPGYDGAGELDARMETIDRWMSAEHSTKPHWVLEAGAFPLAHGDLAQEKALWGMLAWGTVHPIMKGLVVFESADYDSPLGLRTPSGRIRSAARGLATAARSLAESIDTTAHP
jgi:hypothetical protein